METAAAWQILRAGQIIAEQDALGRMRGIRHRNRRNQRFGIRMVRRMEKLMRFAHFK